MSQITDQSKLSHSPNFDFSYSKTMRDKQPSSNNLFGYSGQKTFYIGLFTIAAFSEMLFKLVSYPINLGMRAFNLTKTNFHAETDLKPPSAELEAKRTKKRLIHRDLTTPLVEKSNSSTTPPAIDRKLSGNKSASTVSASVELENSKIDNLELSPSDLAAAASTVVLIAAPYNADSFSAIHFLGTLVIARIMRTVAACFMGANALRGKVNPKKILVGSLVPVISPPLTSCTIIGASLLKLRNCVKNVTTEPIKAVSHGLVHTFNAGTGVLELLCSGIGPNRLSNAEKISNMRHVVRWLKNYINPLPMTLAQERAAPSNEYLVKWSMADLFQLP